jgi:2-keto-4-pentenoate hydratase
MTTTGASPELTQSELERLAAQLLEAFESGLPIEPLTATHPELSVADAYRIQRALLRGHERAGRRVVGRKIGLTSLAIQRQLGVDSPDFGALLDTCTFASGATISRSQLRTIAPRIEPEVAVVLARPLPTAGVTAADVSAATSEILAVMELIDSRVRDWRVKLPDTVADNASCYGAIVGERRPWPADVEPRELSVELSRDGVVEVRGTGDAVMGDPFAAVAWLANALGSHGDQLPVGQLVLSGSLTAAIDAVPGRYLADFGPALGTASIEVTE